MNKRVGTGILAGVVAAMVLLAVAGIAYKAGEGHEDKDREVVTRPVVPVGPGGQGDVVRVIDDHDEDGPGKAGFIMFPLMTILLVLLLVWAFKGGFNGGFPSDPQARFDEYHRRAHDRAGPGPAEPAET